MNSCCLCGNTAFIDVFNLGPLPLGFPMEPDQMASEAVWRKDYQLVLCNNCLLGQTIHKVPDQKLTAENLYLSKRVKAVSDHDRDFALHIPSQLSLQTDSMIMEIGCGDGSLLEQFQKAGYSKLLGIEPSPHGGDYPFDIVTDYFNSKIVDQLIAQNQQPDLVIANYVIELIPDLHEFFKNLAELMKDGSFLVIEVPYLNSFLNGFRLDGFAHLRCNWLTMESLMWAFKKFGFRVKDIFLDETYRGGTLQAVAQRSSADVLSIPSSLAERLRQEKDELTAPFFSALRSKIDLYRDATRDKINDLCNKGVSLYGYGGGLKASTIVNFLGLTTSQITMTIDIDPNKQNKVIPVANIPIRPRDELFYENTKEIGVIMLALDHLAEAEDYLKGRLRKGSLLIHVLPEYETFAVK